MKKILYAIIALVLVLAITFFTLFTKKQTQTIKHLETSRDINADCKKYVFTNICQVHCGNVGEINNRIVEEIKKIETYLRPYFM